MNVVVCLFEDKMCVCLLLLFVVVVCLDGAKRQILHILMVQEKGQHVQSESGKHITILSSSGFGS